MYMVERRAFTFYVSVVLYIAFIFFTQWSVAAQKMGDMWLSNMLSSVVSFAILPSIIALAVYGIVINFQYYMRHRWFTVGFLAALLFIAITTRSLSFTLPLLLGFTGFLASNRKIAKIAVVSLGLFLLTSYVLSMLGLDGGDTMSKPLFGSDRTEIAPVTALGLSNPNAVMVIFFNVIALQLFLSKTKRQDFFTSVVLLFLIIALSIGTGSTTGIVMGVITLFVVLGAKHSRRILKILRRITPWMFLIVTVVTFVVAINFGFSNGEGNNINDTLTGRPSLWNMRVENGSYINLYGNNDQYQVAKTADPSKASYALDNMPLYILVHFGLIIYLIILFIFYSGSKNTRDPAILAYIFAATILMFMEKMELYALVLLFLQKAIAESRLLSNKEIEEIRA